MAITRFPAVARYVVRWVSGFVICAMMVCGLAVSSQAHEESWIERGWVLVDHRGAFPERFHPVLIDPARIRDRGVYWDAANSICDFENNCFLFFFVDVNRVTFRINENFDFHDYMVGEYIYSFEDNKSFFEFSCAVEKRSYCIE